VLDLLQFREKFVVFRLRQGLVGGINLEIVDEQAGFPESVTSCVENLLWCFELNGGDAEAFEIEVLFELFDGVGGLIRGVFWNGSVEKERLGGDGGLDEP